ncbi:MAG TPA: hypothetical protein VFA18_14900 [Gemmataceae bacterium]|nr:hypothetical protein [Gemmataceae bacterium]
MTQYDWLHADEPQTMLLFLRDSQKLNDRELRLFTVACCRRVWQNLTHEKSRRAVEVAEEFADQEERLDRASRLHALLGLLRTWKDAGADGLLVANNPFRLATEYASWAVKQTIVQPEQAKERKAQADLVRDIFGNPFQDVSFDPAWRTPAVLESARRVYEDRHLPAGTLDAGLLAALAEALQQAGCRESRLLEHLRQPADHVRGCWVLDLLLGLTPTSKASPPASGGEPPAQHEGSTVAAVTAAEWSMCTEPVAMLLALRDCGRASERKMRLYVAGCCREVWHLLPDERSRTAVEAAEQYADGLLSNGELERAFHATGEAFRVLYRHRDFWPETTLRLRRQHHPQQLKYAAFLAGFAAGPRAGDISTHLRVEKGAPNWALPNPPSRARLLRCIFRNPFHAAPVNPVWVTPSAVALAREVYEDRAFSLLGDLADVLEPAGCSDLELLAHLRSPGPHMRGCFAVDTVLAKA